MEYIYAAMLLHRAGKQITEDAVKKVLTAAGVSVEEARLKALVTALQGVNIDEAIKKAATVAAPVAVSASGAPAEAKKEEKPKEDKKKVEEEAAAAAGLGALFG